MLTRNMSARVCPLCNSWVSTTCLGDYQCISCKLRCLYTGLKLYKWQEYCELYDYHPWWRKLFGLGPVKRGRWVKCKEQIMSYDVDLVDEAGLILHMETPFVDGGIYRVAGTTQCTLNITYNYAEVFGGLVRELHNRVAKDTLPELQAFVDKWQHTRPYERDYWAPTPGNAKAAIRRLISFAEKHPDGVWSVS